MPDQPLITLALPYYNEAGFIGATLRSLAAQTDRRFRLVLIDNGSTDGSEVIARAACEDMLDIGVSFVSEAKPGKIHALIAGTAIVETPYLGTIDADTIYPPGYVAQALDLLAQNPQASCALAFGLDSQGRHTFQRFKLRVFSLVFPRKCHTGGYAQVFDAAAFRRGGGFDVNRWPHVLEDHEIVHRLLQYGPALYCGGFECYPSDRRQDRSSCSWSLMERVLYKVLPSPLMDWFFYRFLGPRLAGRGLGNLRLRERDWQSDDRSGSG